MTVESIERELKLMLPDRAAADRLAARLGKPASIERQRNTYFDRDESWSDARWSVRIRRTDEDQELTIKGPAIQDGAFSKRGEWTLALTRTEADAAAEGHLPVSDLIERLVARDNIRLPSMLDVRGLTPIGGTQTQRQRYGFPGRSDLVIELDETLYPDGSTVHEVELELPSTEPSRPVIQALEQLFLDTGLPWQLGTVSKQTRFLASRRRGSNK